MGKLTETIRKVKKPKTLIIVKKKKKMEVQPKSDENKKRSSDRRKREEKEKDEEPDEPEDDIVDADGIPVPKFFITKSAEQQQAFDKFAKQVFTQGVDGLLKEYNEQLAKYIGQPAARVIFDKNAAKNRYKDVVCNDLTRVVINDGKPNDYIHANHVRGEPLFNEYVCTQGPTTATRDDFWRMIMFLKAERIVMLCQTTEGGKIKCDQYWPAEEKAKMAFGDIVVENITTLAGVSGHSKSIATTKLKISQKSTSFTVFHHHWKTWPDRSVPSSTKDALRVLRAIRFSGKPAVIHCSAGIGRTGTLVAIEMCIQSILKTQSLNLVAICKRLRDQRLGVLQVDVQFVYMALAVIDFGMSMGFMGKDFATSPYKKDFHFFKKNLVAVVASRGLETSAPPPPKTSAGNKGSCDTVGAMRTVEKEEKLEDADEKIKESQAK